MADALQHRVKQDGFEDPVQEAFIGLLVAGGHIRQRLNEVCAGYGTTHDQYNVLRILRGVYPEGHPRHEIIERTDGERLQESIDHERPDLVLMDIQLPGQDGFALLESIRSSAVPDCRVVALTAHAMAGDRERALQAGFDGYISKPIDIRAFPDQIERALAGETVTD